mmetsp:Transcript_22642/g.57711  ORF Transcript_22642/g.57711 Transcript_22642/m.57711 type:complete len:119 (+) Transcript_22642:111-467(+)
MEELNSVMTALKMPCVYEKKHYPRSTWYDPTGFGRVKVQVKREDGTYVREEIKSRKELYVAAGHMIQRLEKRSTIKDPFESLKRQTADKEKKPEKKAPAKQTTAKPKQQKGKGGKKKK